MTDMYADEDPGLTIDAPDSGDEENPDKFDDEKKSKKIKEPVFNYISGDEDGNNGLEDGEIPNEPMIKNFLQPNSQSPGKKRKMTQMVDASTCVSETEDLDDTTMKTNQYYKLNVLILSRSSTSSGHTFTFTTNIKGQMYYGVLTDGSPPVIHNNQIQKRAMAAEKDKNNDENDTNEKHDSTPKIRGHKRSKNEDERTPTKTKLHRHKSSHLKEIATDPYIRCPHKQCGHRFIGYNDLNSHLMYNHVDGGVTLKEDIATQTTEPFTGKCRVCEQREQKMREENSINQLFGGIKVEKPNIKKDDDDVAPKLEKEEPASEQQPSSSPNLEAVVRDSRLPTMPSLSARPEQSSSTTTPIPSSATTVKTEPQPPTLPMMPQAVPPNMQPFVWNGNILPNNGINLAAAVSASAAKPPILNASFPVMPQPSMNGVSPVPSGSKVGAESPARHKLHELKAEPGTSNVTQNNHTMPTTATVAGNIQGRSITAGTAGPSMETLLRMQRPPIQTSVNPQGLLPPFMQNQMFFRHLLTNPELNLALLNAQQQGVFQPPK